MRVQRRRARITLQEALFLQRALESDSPIQRKLALQRLCSLYRNGGRLTQEATIKGHVLQCLTCEDPKVRRWAFNSLALLGTKADVALMQVPWRNSREEPEVFEAGLTALARVLPRDDLMLVLKQAEVELGPATLLALGQQTNAYARELAALRLDVSQASTQELRSATLLIGLQQAPESLFSPRYPVSDIIGDLNTHPDSVVAQYSFWAEVEHPNLGLANCRVLPKDFPTLPPNVQGWACRLLTKRGESAAKHHEGIVAASESEHAIVREGMATALRHTFYDGLDVVVLDWFMDEDNPFVRDRLLEHMAAHAGGNNEYHEEVLSAFRAGAPGSILRNRIEAANCDDALSLEMRKIALQTGDPDLFTSIAGPTVNNNTMNFNGPVNAGGISSSGAGNSGNVQLIATAKAQERAIMLLTELLERLEKGPATAEVSTVRDAVKAATEKPTKSTVERVVTMLKELKDGGEAAAWLGALLARGYENLVPLLPNLPHLW